jgi:hypothetical protein
MVQSWYSVAARARNDVLYVFEPAAIHRVICNDSFHLGLDPSTFLRRLKINISLHALISDGKEDSCGVKNAEQRQELIIDPLRKIQNKKGFQLTVKIWQEHIRLDLWPEIFDTFKVPVDECENEGAHVNVFFAYYTGGSGNDDNARYDLKKAI